MRLTTTEAATNKHREILRQIYHLSIPERYRTIPVVSGFAIERIDSCAREMISVAEFLSEIKRLKEAIDWAQTEWDAR